MSEENTRSPSAIAENRPAQPRDPAVEFGAQLYRNLTMSSDAVLHLLPHVKDERIRTQLTAALSFYDKTAGKVKELLTDHGARAEEEGLLSRLSARMGIVVNTAMDATDSHIAQMVIEGSTMLITEAEKLKHEYEDKPDCGALMTIVGVITRFENEHIERMKEFL